MNFNTFFQQTCHSMGDKKFITFLKDDETFTSISGSDFYKETQIKIAHLQLSAQVDKKIVFWSDNSIELLVLFFASLALKNKVCIVDQKLTPAEVANIVKDFEPNLIFCDLTRVDFCESFDLVKSRDCYLYEISDFMKMPKSLKTENIEEKTDNNPEVIVYTSGTLGTPKGVVIDVESLIFEAQSLKAFFKRDYALRKTLSILPLNHIYGLVVLFFNLNADQELLLPQSLAPQLIRKIIQEQRPNYLYVVPQFLVLIKNKITSEVLKLPLLQRYLVFFLLNLNSWIKSPQLARIFFRKIREQIGSSIDFIVSGGAHLPEDVFDFFEALHMPVLNGYGLSETTAVITCNNLSERKRGSVGKVIDGVEVKVDSMTQEIGIRGPTLFKGYYLKPEMTSETFDSDGWFRTGDLGYLDQEQFLFITGRSKNMIILSSGKKIQPEEIEIHFSQLDFIKNSCLLSIRIGKTSKTNIDSQKLVLLIELNENISLLDDVTKKNLVDRLREHSKGLASYKHPQEFQFRTTPFPMTSTLKIKRFLVQQELERNN